MPSLSQSGQALEGVSGLAFILKTNGSTMSLLYGATALSVCSVYWWHSSRQQSSKASVSISAISTMPTLDLRALLDDQLSIAEHIFNDFRGVEFKPAYIADLDSSRAALESRRCLRSAWFGWVCPCCRAGVVGEVGCGAFCSRQQAPPRWFPCRLNPPSPPFQGESMKRRP